ncbi:MAG: tetratricopeptide repeat protein [Gammaproteobacteria bacterium]
MRAAAFFWHSGDHDRGLDHLERAREIDPDHWLVLAAEASDHLSSQRLDEAIEVTTKALRLDPLNATTRHNLATMNLYAGRYEAALAEYGRIGDMYPSTAVSPDQSMHIVKALLLLGRYDEALGWIRALPDGQPRTYALALVLHALDDAADADQALAELETGARSPADLLAVAEVHAYRGDPAQSVAWLQRLAPRLECGGEVMPRTAFYSPFIAGLKPASSTALREWRRDAARRMAECRY